MSPLGTLWKYQIFVVHFCQDLGMLFPCLMPPLNTPNNVPLAHSPVLPVADLRIGGTEGKQHGLR